MKDLFKHDSNLSCIKSLHYKVFTISELDNKNEKLVPKYIVSLTAT